MFQSILHIQPGEIYLMESPGTITLTAPGLR